MTKKMLTPEDHADIAKRLWTVASLLRDRCDLFDACAEVCDDIAMLHAAGSGQSYDKIGDDHDLKPTYKYGQ